MSAKSLKEDRARIAAETASRHQLRRRPQERERSCLSSRPGKGACCAGQNDPELGEFARLRFDLDRPAMLFNDDAIAQREAKAGSLAGGFCRKERIEHLFLHLGRNAGAVVADSNFDAVTEVFGRGNDGGLVACKGCALRLVAA